MEQQSDEWWKARLGKITASRMGDALAGVTTKRYKQYRKELVLGLKGIPIEADTTSSWSEYGHQWEPVARAQYEWKRNVLIREQGVLVHPQHEYVSCSPDGLVGEDGGVEIKSRIKKSYWETHRGKVPSTNRYQIQACLWISGRKWWDLLSFHPPELLDITRVYPDPLIFEKMETACVRLMKECINAD